MVEPGDAEVLVWAEPAKANELDALLHGTAAGVKWVQLPWAGIEPYVDVIHDDRIWTCGKGVYAEPVAEHALTLLLAGLRGLDTVCAGVDVDTTARNESAPRQGRHRRRRRHHRVAVAPARSVQCRRHGGAPQSAGDDRCHARGRG